MKAIALPVFFFSIVARSLADNDAPKFPKPLSPEEAQEFAAHFKRGKTLYGEDRFEEALSEFTKALAINVTQEAHEWLTKTAEKVEEGRRNKKDF